MTSKPITIRKATAEDILFLQAMSWEAVLVSPRLLASPGAEALQKMEEQYWRRWKEHPDPAFVALDTTGRKLGAIIMRPHGTDEPVYGWRISIAVEVQARSQGIGQRLIERAITFAREKSAPYVNLFVDSTNTQAIALYQRVGFVQAIARYQRVGIIEVGEVDQIIEMRINF